MGEIRMSTIEIRNLSKTYGKTQALKNVSLSFLPGKIVGFLGRNGAGKTTLLNIVTNRIFADQGEVFIDAESAFENDRAQGKIFYVTEKILYPGSMRVKEVYRLTQDFYPGFDLAYAQQLAARFQLEPGKKVEALSTGYKSILKLILALASNAPLLLLDEPVLGLDANHRDLFYRELLAHFNAQTQTVVLSTHLIEEAANLLEDVIILHEGEILLSRPIEDILRLAYTVSGSQEAVDRYAAGKKVIREEYLGKYKAATIFQERSTADQELLANLELDCSPAHLQEVFICLTNPQERLLL
jgi:ABC-2 type transport system ATP-binding protein